MRLILIAALFTLLASATSADPAPDVAARLRTSLAPHPRLFLTAGQEARIRTAIAGDPQLASVNTFIRTHADELLTQQPVQRVMTGRRLLWVSRDLLDRTLTLGLTYRLTGDKRYAECARANLLAAAAFTDWNPAHFLDVAEMTAAMGIGYDWFYDQLSPADRQTLRTAIVEKGLTPSLAPNLSWVTCDNNWAQVCHGGLTIGALAIADDQPDLAQRIIARTVASLGPITAKYEPDGAYPEGPLYWRYGTTYHVMLISALQSALSTDFGLSNHPGFMKAPDFILHTTGPSGEWFNFSDSGPRITFLPAMWWFAAQRKDPSLLHFERQLTAEVPAPGEGIAHRETTRFTPFILLWAPADLAAAPAPSATSYVAAGDTPIAAFRSSWKPDASWVALKGGSVQTNHSHMDIGSFLVDALGVRWAEDLGYENYNALEQRKINLWDNSVGGTRWQVFRLGPTSHNIITVDGREQIIKARATFIRSGENFATLNLSEIYAGQLASATRTVRLTPNGTIRIEDELTAPKDAPAKIRWAFVTHATLTDTADNTATLTLNDKKLTLRLTGVNARFQTYSTQSPHDYDTPNPNTRMIGFDLPLTPNQKATATIDFIPNP